MYNMYMMQLPAYPRVGKMDYITDCMYMHLPESYIVLAGYLYPAFFYYYR